MAGRPKAVLFDVNETLFSMEPLRERLAQVGLAGPSDLEVCSCELFSAGHIVQASMRYTMQRVVCLGFKHSQASPAIEVCPIES